MRFDHLVHWVPDRAAGVAAYRAAGFHMVIGGEHPGWGTHNALSHFGLGYIEVVARHDPTLPLPPIFAPGPRLLARGGGAANFAVAVPDMAAALADLRARGFAVGDPQPGARTRPDGTTLRWQTATLTVGPAWRPFLIQWGDPDPWRLQDLRARAVDAPHPAGLRSLRHLVIATADPAADAAWAGRLLGVAPKPEAGPLLHTAGGPSPKAGPAYRVPLPGCDLVLVPAPAAGLTPHDAPLITHLVVAGGPAATHAICGLTVITGP
jgi:hypothetical protein